MPLSVSPDCTTYSECVGVGCGVAGVLGGWLVDGAVGLVDVEGELDGESDADGETDGDGDTEGDADALGVALGDGVTADVPGGRLFLSSCMNSGLIRLNANPDSGTSAMAILCLLTNADAFGKCELKRERPSAPDDSTIGTPLT